MDNTSIEFYLVENITDLCIGGKCLSGYPNPRKPVHAATLDLVRTACTETQKLQFEQLLAAFTNVTNVHGIKISLPQGLRDCLFASLIRYFPYMIKKYTANHIIPAEFLRLCSKFHFTKDIVLQWAQLIHDSFVKENQIRQSKFSFLHCVLCYVLPLLSPSHMSIAIAAGASDTFMLESLLQAISDLRVQTVLLTSKLKDSTETIARLSKEVLESKACLHSVQAAVSSISTSTQEAAFTPKRKKHKSATTNEENTSSQQTAECVADTLNSNSNSNSNSMATSNSTSISASNVRQCQTLQLNQASLITSPTHRHVFLQTTEVTLEDLIRIWFSKRLDVNSSDWTALGDKKICHKAKNKFKEVRASIVTYISFKLSTYYIYFFGNMLS